MAARRDPAVGPHCAEMMKSMKPETMARMMKAATFMQACLVPTRKAGNGSRAESAPRPHLQ